MRLPRMWPPPECVDFISNERLATLLSYLAYEKEMIEPEIKTGQDFPTFHVKGESHQVKVANDSMYGAPKTARRAGLDRRLLAANQGERPDDE